MTVPRDIADLHRRMKLEGRQLFSRNAAHELETPDFVAVARNAGMTPTGLLNALRAIEISHEHLAPRLVDARFVATLPGTAIDQADQTFETIRDMLSRAQRYVVVIGYEVGDVEFVSCLQAAARRVDVSIIADRARLDEKHPLRDWPKSVNRPTLFVDRRRDGAAPYAKMHGKALLVDGAELLVTSANFTFHGLNENVEFGVKLAGPVAGRAADFIRELTLSGLLEKIV